jgi:hypothetical protein
LWKLTGFPRQTPSFLVLLAMTVEGSQIESLHPNQPQASTHLWGHATLGDYFTGTIWEKTFSEGKIKSNSIA